MRVKLGRWNSGDPPSLVIVAETEDDTKILGAIADGYRSHDMALGDSYNCSPTLPGQLAGTFQISLIWFKKKPRDADTFEPIGDAAARVVKSLTVGADDALGGLMARKPTEDK